jgi:hypothetical protein
MFGGKALKKENEHLSQVLIDFIDASK